MAIIGGAASLPIKNTPQPQLLVSPQSTVPTSVSIRGREGFAILLDTTPPAIPIGLSVTVVAA